MKVTPEMGAISVGNDTDLVIQESTFIGNSAADHGGAIAYLPAFFAVRRSLVFSIQL